MSGIETEPVSYCPPWFLPWVSSLTPLSGWPALISQTNLLPKLFLHVRTDYISSGHVSSSPSEILLLHISLELGGNFLWENVYRIKPIWFSDLLWKWVALCFLVVTHWLKMGKKICPMDLLRNLLAMQELDRRKKRRGEEEGWEKVKREKEMRSRGAGKWGERISWVDLKVNRKQVGVFSVIWKWLWNTERYYEKQTRGPNTATGSKCICLWLQKSAESYL